MIRRAALGLLALSSATRAAAQSPPEIRLEVGHATVRQRALAASDAALFAVFWRRPAERWTFFTSGNLTYARDTLAAAQGVAAISVPWEGREHLRTDFGGAGASFSLRSAGSGGNGNAFVRQHLVRDQGGAWLGGAAAATVRDARRSRSRAVDAGAWARYRFLYGSASLSRQYSTDWPLLLTSGIAVSPFASAFELEDVQVVLQARGGPHELTGSWTHRRAVAGADAEVVAVSASGVLQLTDRVAFLATAGRQLSDPMRGLPEADLVTASLRVSFGRKPLPVMQRSAVAHADVERRGGGGADLTIRVFAIDTLAVEVAGDFSAWRPLPLERDGSFWVARATLVPGKYHVGVRIRGGPWRAPRNLARVRDDYGGESGLIVIP